MTAGNNYPFNSIYAHGFIRTAVAVPFVRVADPAFNSARIIELAQQADAEHAALVLFPELSISAYAIDDLLTTGCLA